MRTHIISHTHWDREWYLTYEQFRMRLVGLVDRLLDMMETRPDYEYFHLDGQTIVLEDYLELRPQNEARLRRLISAGRILIGPWYDMPDEFLVSGESLVRNLALGHRIASRYGETMPVGYLPDLFGHVAQMPQILRNFGLDNAVLWRGFGGLRAEYWWQSPDGSRVLMMHLPPQGYCNATRVHLDPAQMIDRATAAIAAEAARTSVGEVLLMNGVDHVEPHPVIPQLAKELTAALGQPVRHSTLPAYVAAVRSAVNRDGSNPLDVIAGELRSGEEYANLLPGVFSARTYIKKANTRVQTLLEHRAEPLATFAWMLGARYPTEELAYAWKTLLQNHPHDSICGCSIDPVHEENMTRFARAEQVARGVVDHAADVIARAVPAAAPGTLRVVALNTTGQPFAGTIEATVDLPYESDEPRRLVDRDALDAPVTFWPRDVNVVSVTTHDGRPSPIQVLGEEFTTPLIMSRYETPWILRARRMTLAWPGEVPACGYAAFDLNLSSAGAPVNPEGDEALDISTGDSSEVPGSALDTAAGVAGLRVSDRSAENEHVQIAINDDGTVDVVDKRTGTRYARCGEIEDVGDVGDEYNFSPPSVNPRFSSEDAEDVSVTRLDAGPVRASFRIDFALRLPESASGDRTSRAAELVATDVRMVITLDSGSPRIGWRVAIDNRSKDHRLRLLFPLGAESVTEVRAETAFGVARRQARRTVPAENRWEVPVSYGPTGSFTEAGDDASGAVLFGEGLMEYEAVGDTEGRASRLALTLLRCVGYLSREDLAMRPSGHAGPGLATPGAQCLGRHEFRIAFEPRGKASTNGELFARAASFVAPPEVFEVIGSDGTIPTMGSFLALDRSQGDVVLSACHKSDVTDAVIVRVFNPDDTPATVRVRPRRVTKRASRVDFLGRTIDTLSVDEGTVRIDIAPHQISTAELD